MSVLATTRARVDGPARDSRFLLLLLTGRRATLLHVCRRAMFLFVRCRTRQDNVLQRMARQAIVSLRGTARLLVHSGSLSLPAARCLRRLAHEQESSEERHRNAPRWFVRRRRRRDGVHERRRARLRPCLLRRAVRAPGEDHAHAWVLAD